MVKQQFFTVSQAAEKLKIPETEILDLAMSAALPICFRYVGEITSVSVLSPGEKYEEILDIDFRGILRSLTQPTEDYRVYSDFVVLVSLVRCDGLRYSHHEGKLTRGHRLPTQTDHGGYILADYKVEGYIEDVDVPSGNWLFHVDDLEELINDKTPGPALEPQATPVVADNALGGVTFDKGESVMGDSANWKPVKPKRFRGYSKPVYDLLRYAHIAGQPCPTAREVLDVWKIKRPPEVFEIMSDGLKYYDALGDIKVVKLNAISKVIGRMIQ